jgi:uncharacterized protein YbaR (Trm112 family)
MPISSQLLEILVCPVTKLPLSFVNQEKLKQLNDKISNGEIVSKDGNAVTEAIDEALITSNSTTIYRVQDSIPIMLEDQGIDASQLG